MKQTMRCCRTHFLSCNHKPMNPFGSRRYLADVQQAGKDMEAQEAKGLAILLEDTSQEVLSIRARIEGHYRTEERHRANMQEELCSLKKSVKQLLEQQDQLVQTLNGSSTAAWQVAAQGTTQTLSLMEAGRLPQQRAMYRPPPPRLGLVGGFLYHLDVWALQLFQKNACNE